MPVPEYYYKGIHDNYDLPVMVLVIIIFLSPPSSGFWGVLCVGIFSRPCLIRELFEGLCFCCESVLPDTVSMYYCTVMLLVGIIVHMNTGYSTIA